MENKKPSNEIDSSDQLAKTDSTLFDMPDTSPLEKQDSNSLPINDSTPVVKNKPDSLGKPESINQAQEQAVAIPKKPLKPPKLEDKPFGEFISQHLIPGLKTSIQEKGTLVKEIKLLEGIRPVVGGNCWMVYCEISEQRRFWLCFSKELITSDKTILLAESDSDPSIVESFLIDEKKSTLPLLISRVLQRLNGQKWIGAN